MSGGDPTTVHATFVFADIAGFTALTETHGEQAAWPSGGRDFWGSTTEGRP